MVGGERVKDWAVDDGLPLNQKEHCQLIVGNKGEARSLEVDGAMAAGAPSGTGRGVELEDDRRYGVC